MKDPQTVVPSEETLQKAGQEHRGREVQKPIILWYAIVLSRNI